MALAHTIRRFDLPREPFERLIEANRRDQRITRYETFDQLLDYCTYSANPVGRLVLRVFGYDDETLDQLSDETCTALQLANMWQDVSRDFELGRIYIPREDMARFGVHEDDIASSRVTHEVRRLIRFQVRRTREYFARRTAARRRCRRALPARPAPVHARRSRRPRRDRAPALRRALAAAAHLQPQDGQWLALRGLLPLPLLEGVA